MAVRIYRLGIRIPTYRGARPNHLRDGFEVRGLRSLHLTCTCGNLLFLALCTLLVLFLNAWACLGGLGHSPGVNFKLFPFSRWSSPHYFLRIKAAWVHVRDRE